MTNSVTASNIYMNKKRYDISPEKRKKIRESRDHVVSSTPLAKMRYFEDKFVNAFTIYPAKGLKGDRNSNFYEFLAMGIVPYTIGSLMMMGLFNYTNKFFKPHVAKAASRVGTKMALGVLLYGVAKEVSKKFISVPVNMFTGVDINMPYQKWINEFAKSDFSPGAKSTEYHGVYESTDFPYHNILYYIKDGEPRNYYYDKIAKKLGKGDDLQTADQEVKPAIKKIIVRSKAATSISSFLWAATGVAYAAQDSWGDLFTKTNKSPSIRKNLKTMMEHVKNLAKNSAIEFWQGSGATPKANAYAGRILLTAAVLSSVLGVFSTVYGVKYKKPEQNVIDANKEYVVD